MLNISDESSDDESSRPANKSGGGGGATTATSNSREGSRRESEDSFHSSIEPESPSKNASPLPLLPNGGVLSGLSQPSVASSEVPPQITVQPGSSSSYVDRSRSGSSSDPVSTSGTRLTKARNVRK